MNTRRNFLQMAGAALAFGSPLAQAGPARPDPRSLPYVPLDLIPNHRQLMRDIVVTLSDYCKKRRPDCVVLARNAPELLIRDQREVDLVAGLDPDGARQGRYGGVGSIDGPYLAALDGMVVDGAFYGHDEFGKPTEKPDREPLLAAAEILRRQGRKLMSIDFCKDKSQIADASSRAGKAHFLPFISGAGDRRLAQIPSAPPGNENSRHVTDLAQAVNFLPLLSSTGYGRREEWLDALAGTNYDLLLIDPFFRGASLTVQEIRALKFKRLGSQRMIIAPLPVGVAAIDRFFWQRGWKPGNPEWIAGPDPNDPGRFYVSYWMESWKAIIGNYVTGLCDLGVDGVMLDGLDTYLFYEAMLPL